MKSKGQYEKSISKDDIYEALQIIEKGKSPDVYGMVSEYFIQMEKNGIKFLEILFNKMFDFEISSNHSTTSPFGNIYHYASYIQLIPKSDHPIDKYMINNQRPITIIPIINKLYSLIILKRLQSFCNNHSIIPDNQTGFREDLNTTNNLIILRSLFENAKIDNKECVVCFIDFKKAYDSVNHSILKWIMKSQSIPNKLISTIMTSLYDNKVSIKTMYGNVTAKLFKNNTADCKQPSCLILF